MSFPRPNNPRAFAISTTEIVFMADFVNNAQEYQFRVNGTIVGASQEPYYEDTGLAPGTSRSYEMRSRGIVAGGTLEYSEWTVPVTATTPTDDPTPPATLDAPVITNAAQTDLLEATILWDPVEGATSYEVERNSAIVATPTATVFVDTVPTEAEYSYRVRALNATLTSDWSAPRTVNVQGLVAPNPTATPLSNSIIEVTWPVIGAAASYKVETENVGTVNIGGFTRFLDTDLLPETTRRYRVRALLGEVEGPWSDWVAATSFPFVAPTLTGIKKRLSRFLAREHITARALNAEFNNIFVLLGSPIVVEPPPAIIEPPPPAEPPNPENPGPTPPEPPPPPPPEPPGGDAVVTVSGTEGNAHTIDLPAPTADTHTVIVVCAHSDAVADAPTGWQWILTSGGPGPRFFVLTRYMDGGEPATVDVTISNVSKLTAVAIRVSGPPANGLIEMPGVFEWNEGTSGTATLTFPVVSAAPPFSGVPPAMWLAVGTLHRGDRVPILNNAMGSFWSSPRLAATGGTSPTEDLALTVAWRISVALQSEPGSLTVSGPSDASARAYTFGLRNAP